MKIYDKVLDRFVEDTDTADITNAERYELLNDEPDVLAVHLVADADHDIVLLINGWEIQRENHMDDDWHRTHDCTGRLGVKIARSLGTYLDSRRVPYAEFIADGHPSGAGLARLARSITSKRRPFAESAMTHAADDRATHDPATVRNRSTGVTDDYVCVDCHQRTE